MNHGRQLVLVSYDLDKHYPGDELVHNSADFDSQKILWARSKGAERTHSFAATTPIAISGMSQPTTSLFR